MRVLPALLLAVLLPGTARADDAAAEPLTIVERFSGSTFLFENAFSVGHGGDLAADASRYYAMSWVFTPSFAFTRSVSMSLRVPLTEELTEGVNTFDQELVLGNMLWSVDATLPAPPVAALSGAAGLALELPTSKIARAESLVLGVGPYFTAAVTAPLLDGLSVSWTGAPSPRLQRYTTWSNATPRPCSPAAGCTFGPAGTVDTGWRTTAFQMVQDFAVALSALDSRLTASATLRLVHGRLHPKSASQQWDEAIVSTPANAGGDPWNLTYTFLFDVGFRVHPFAAVSVGVWTPGGMRPGGGWYPPFGNRFTQLYVNVTLTPTGLTQ